MLHKERKASRRKWEGERIASRYVTPKLEPISVHPCTGPIIHVSKKFHRRLGENKEIIEPFRNLLILKCIHVYSGRAWHMNTSILIAIDQMLWFYFNTELALTAFIVTRL